LLLPDRLIVQNDAADAGVQSGRGQDRLAPAPPAFFVLLDADVGEALVAGAVALIHREHAFAARDKGCGDVDQ
jgi:hypothetical protein